ncbi:hypothetical protein [Absidia glauca]|uniref:Uncharacterized protein n=1 Tax=Absidia glauca TaxID=4829 RepID=A0A168QEQ0_ABSGL|nr:hypothetical protein [Absidia glauca]
MVKVHCLMVTGDIPAVSSVAGLLDHSSLFRGKFCTIKKVLRLNLAVNNNGILGVFPLATLKNLAREGRFRDLKKAIHLMRQMIGERENLAVYQDFFFVSYAHGLKCPVTKLSDFSKAFKNEIDMAVAHGETSKLYLDYAIEMLPSDGSNVCGVWLNNAFPSVGDIKCHMAALSPFFPSVELAASKYRYDGVLGFRSLAGCGYKASPSVDGSGELGVHSVKMYSSFKRPFFHRNSGGSGHTKDLSAYDVWAYERRAEGYIAFATRTADSMSGQPFPARLEVTVTYDVAWEDQDHLILLMRPIQTVDDLQFLRKWRWGKSVGKQNCVAIVPKSALTAMSENRPVLCKEYLNSLMDACPEGKNLDLLRDVNGLFNLAASITIYHNYELNKALKPLAQSLSSEISTLNRNVAANIKSRLHNE